MNVKAIRYYLMYQPGLVSFDVRDIHCKAWTVVEKIPVVGLPYPVDESEVPFEFEAPSRIIESYMNQHNRKVLKIEFLHHIESNDGETKFEVYAEDYAIKN